MNYKEIDLGLSVKWADRNIGANSPEDSGLYFQWGDTRGYSKEQVGVDKDFTCDDYKFGTKDNLTKYNNTDRKTVLETEDDAAHVIMGGDWKLPTKDELEELWQLPKKFVFQTRETASIDWGEPTDYEDVKSLLGSGTMKFDDHSNWIEGTSTIKFCGIKFIGTNGNELFVPVVGLCFEGSLMLYGYGGFLWSSSLGGSVSSAWLGLFNYGGYSVVGNNDRCNGLPLRGVKTKIDVNNKLKKQMLNEQEYILCSAIKRNTPKDCVKHLKNNDIYNIEIGYRHCDIYARFQKEVSSSPSAQGFYTSFGRFVDRKEALEIAIKSHQVDENKCVNKNIGLFSEDLY